MKIPNKVKMKSGLYIIIGVVAYLHFFKVWIDILTP